MPRCNFVRASMPAMGWARKKQSIADSRSLVYTAVLRWIVHFIKAGCLQLAVVENVMGICNKWNGSNSFMDCVLQSLRTECPEFEWKIDKLRAEDYKLAQERNRVFLRGIRRATAALPSVLKPFGEAKLGDFLNFNLPYTRRDEIPEGKRNNLSEIELNVQVKLKKNPQQLRDNCIACAAIDRAGDKTWSQRITYDKTCTLTTANRYLFVFSVHDIHLTDKERKVFRWLHPAERLGLQGLSPKLAKLIPFDMLMKATGNMYPCPFMAAVLSPMLDAISHSVPGACLGTTVPASMPASAFTVRIRKQPARNNTALTNCKRRKQQHQDEG